MQHPYLILFCIILGKNREKISKEQIFEIKIPIIGEELTSMYTRVRYIYLKNGTYGSSVQNWHRVGTYFASPSPVYFQWKGDAREVEGRRRNKQKSATNNHRVIVALFKGYQCYYSVAFLPISTLVLPMTLASLPPP